MKTKDKDQTKRTVSLKPSQIEKLEAIRDKNRHFNLSEEVGKLIDKYHSKHILNNPDWLPQ